MPEEPRLKRPVALTCPSCGGAVEQRSIDSLPYFECHTGHRFAAADMDEAQFQQLEQALDVALRVLNERTELTRRLARQLVAAGDQVEVWTIRHPHHLPADELVGDLRVRRFSMPMPRSRPGPCRARSRASPAPARSGRPRT